MMEYKFVTLTPCLPKEMIIHAESLEAATKEYDSYVERIIDDIPYNVLIVSADINKCYWHTINLEAIRSRKNIYKYTVWSLRNVWKQERIEKESRAIIKKIVKFASRILGMGN